MDQPSFGCFICCIFCCTMPSRTCPKWPVAAECPDSNRLKTDSTGDGDFFAKPLYGLKPVSRVRIPPSPPFIKFPRNYQGYVRFLLFALLFSPVRYRSTQY